MLKLVDEDKHHNRSSVSVIPEDYDPDTPCSPKTFICNLTNEKKDWTGILNFFIYLFFFYLLPLHKIFFPKLMALSPAFKWTQECFKGEE